jgi:hypothetical protein
VKENDIMPTTQKDERFVRLPSDLYAKLVDIAEREDRSVAGSAQYRPRRDRAPDHRTVRPWGCAMSQIMTPDTDSSPVAVFASSAIPRAIAMKSSAAADVIISDKLQVNFSPVARGAAR